METTVTPSAPIVRLTFSPTPSQCQLASLYHPYQVTATAVAPIPRVSRSARSALRTLPLICVSVSLFREAALKFLADLTCAKRYTVK